MQVRVGLPVPGGALLRAAKAINAPLLISASAFMKRWPRATRDSTPFPGFTKPSAELLGCDVALDSAGFVAMVLTRGYEWTVADYVGLAAAHPWTWWSQMDLCCEPEVAHDRDTVRLRQAETTRLYGACAGEARHHGIQPPMPILQGWTADDYARHVQFLPISTGLVGLGSVCRRQMTGPDGLEAILCRLDRELPPGITLHLFGVKSLAVSILAAHPRIESVDSMAWDTQSRRVNRGCNTMVNRTREMTGWYERQNERAAGKGRAIQGGLDIEVPGAATIIPDDLLNLIAEGEIELISVSDRFIEAWIYDSP